MVKSPLKIFSVFAVCVAVLAFSAIEGQRAMSQSVGGNPTFSDDFSSGSMDASKWQVNAYTQSNYAGAGSTVTSRADHCDYSTGMLRIQLDQPTSGTSTDCELQSKQSFGYGTYEWTMRASSTSATPTGTGNTFSGSISTGFILSDANSATEIDSPEIEGQFPTHIEFTNWLNLSNDGAAIITATFTPHSAFHVYGFIWASNAVTFYIDNASVATHTTKVPSANRPGFVLMSHYGTNSSGFGGAASTGQTRYVYFKKFAYYAPGVGAGICPTH